MSRKRLVKKETYQALGDDGETYTVNVYQEMIDAGTLQAPDWIEGFISHKTAEGDAVNVNPDGSLLNVSQQVKMRRI